MITRTFTTTNVKAMAVNVDTATVQNISVMLPEKVAKEDVEKYIKKHGAGIAENIKIVAIQDVDYSEILYGMEESVFLANAVVLPPRGTKKSEVEG